MPWHLPEDLAHFKRSRWAAPVDHGPQDLGLAAAEVPAAAGPAQHRRHAPGGLAGRGRRARRLARGGDGACARDGPTAWVIGGAEIYRAGRCRWRTSRWSPRSTPTSRATPSRPNSAPDWHEVGARAPRSRQRPGTSVSSPTRTPTPEETDMSGARLPRPRPARPRTGARRAARGRGRRRRTTASPAAA